MTYKLKTIFDVLNKPVIARSGTGNEALEMTGQLAIMGYEVILYSREKEYLCSAKTSQWFELSSEFTSFKPAKTTIKTMKEFACRNAYFVPAKDHRHIA